MPDQGIGDFQEFANSVQSSYENAFKRLNLDTKKIPPSAIDVNPHRRIVSAAITVEQVRRLCQECISEEEKKHTEVLAHTMKNIWTCPHPNIGFDAPIDDNSYCLCPFSIYNESWLDAIKFKEPRRGTNKKCPLQP